ncbi:hypothetical protein M422DRAFT_26467 [Sphaerobolus stellatus SS14]|nr:hypothetical protein M422DRAFT_26467 [Sphaerobolus stellatus SS14]
MPSTVTRAFTSMLRTCIRSHGEVSSDSTSYKQNQYHSNKKGIQIVEKAEMLDLEDCAWM